MIVETRVAGGGTKPETSVIELHDPISRVGALLEVLVAAELDRYRLEQLVSNTLRVLTPADLARGVDTGRYGREARPAAPPPPADEALARATEAFEDGLFFLFIDGEQIDSLDEVIDVRTATTVRLVRLVALAGG